MFNSHTQLSDQVKRSQTSFFTLGQNLNTQAGYNKLALTANALNTPQFANNASSRFAAAQLPMPPRTGFGGISMMATAKKAAPKKATAGKGGAKT